MRPLDVSLASLDHSEMAEHLRLLKLYIRDVSDPNERDPSGQTCLTIALAFWNNTDGDELVISLLRRGADPNLPNPFANFHKVMIVATRIEPLAALIGAGLRLNDVYEATPSPLPSGRSGRFTFLDFALDVEAYLNRRGRGLARVASKHGAPLTGRRRFVADVIALLVANGAIRTPATE